MAEVEIIVECYSNRYPDPKFIDFGPFDQTGAIMRAINLFDENPHFDRVEVWRIDRTGYFPALTKLWQRSVPWKPD